MKKIIYLVAIILWVSCSEKPDPIVVGGGGGNTNNINVEFGQANYTIMEGSTGRVILNFSEALKVNSTVNIRVSEFTGINGINYSTSPAIVTNNISLLAATGQDQVELSIEALVDADLKTEEIELEILSVVGTGLSIGNSKVARVTIVDETTVDEQYRDCLFAVNDDEFEIATWNIRQFPQNGNTINTLLDVIPNMDIDVIAVQEITDISDFMSLGNQLDGWSAVVANVSGGIEIGYLYKETSITSFGELKQVFTNDSSAFTREGVEVDITHTNGLTVKVINIHLKCCNDGAQRRIDASNKMKDYIDTNHSDENVIIIGDFNETLGSGSAFSNFSSDPNNFFFADQAIADGATSSWSFPSFPSHIDHILCTDELEDNFVSAYTLTLDDCIGSYEGVVSDHLPVVAVFK